MAVKKQKTNKAEVVQLRESIDLIRKEWTLPNTFKALQSSFDKSKKKIKSLKYEIASTNKEIKNIKEMNDPENQTMNTKLITLLQTILHVRITYRVRNEIFFFFLWVKIKCRRNVG